jgi:hypothetical protein
MIGKRKKGLASTLGVALLALLAFSGLAAGSAQAANWQIYNYGSSKYEPLTSGFKTLAHGAYGSSLTLEVPGRNIKISCQSMPYVGSYITANSGLEYHTKFTVCTVTSLSSGEAVPCTESNTPEFTYAGTAESISSSDKPYLEFKSGTGCPLPLKNQITAPTLSLSYGSPEMHLAVDGSGTGKFGTFSMNISAKYNWMLSEGAPVWGYF